MLCCLLSSMCMYKMAQYVAECVVVMSNVVLFLIGFCRQFHLIVLMAQCFYLTFQLVISRLLLGKS